MRVVVVAVAVFVVCGSAGCGAVDFATVVDGHQFGRSGGLLGKSASIVVDFTDDATVSLDAAATDGDVVTDSGSGVCDRDGDAEGGFGETKLKTKNCVFEFTVTTTDPPADEDIPTALVVGFRNAEDDGSVEIDPSLDADLPFPLSFADDYARLDRVD